MQLDAVLAEALAVIAGHDDHGAIVEALRAQPVEEAPDVQVGVRELAVVERGAIGAERLHLGVRLVGVVRIVVVDPEEPALGGVAIEERERLVGLLARRAAARLLGPGAGDAGVQAGVLVVVLGGALVHVADAIEVPVVGDRAARGEAERGERLGDRGGGGGEAGPALDRGVVGDVERQPAGEDRGDRVARRRRVRPAVHEQRAGRGERVEVRRGPARVAVGAEVIGADRVDRDEEDVEAGAAGRAGRARTRPRRASGRAVASPPTQFWSMPSSGISGAPGWTVRSPSSQSPPPRKRA